MSDKDELNKENEIDFVNSSFMQIALKKSKRKQTVKYIFITVITTLILLFVLFFGNRYILNKRIDDTNEFLFDSIYGANLSVRDESYSYGVLSVTKETTYSKVIGDRTIVWDTETEKIPLIGRKHMIDKGSGMVEVNSLNKEAKRYVRYNEYNNERKIDFYYPGLTYDYLPHELDIATDLDKNKLIEVAISFKKPMTLEELRNQLGQKNVNWLWVDTSSKAQMKRMERELHSDHLKTKGGGGAFGFDVSTENSLPYPSELGFMNRLEQMSKTGSHKNLIKEALIGIKENTQVTDGNIRYNGAVITGTAEELKRFKNLNFIRTSVLGATIDKY